MEKYKVLNEKEMKKAVGGSNDGFWERVGVGIGAAGKCAKRGGVSSMGGACIGYGIGAAIRG
ncbi:enterocin 1071A family bacteriocin [Enterococcus faecalis]|jgi:hypothetical protein|uniref:enterocin 1071A family bacteriocin n=1 Tax=Enterococcus TaxID=1350 RepID=UPI002090B64D|nr:enterocin 1071A family bacteriocin [Enterococcus faecalis]MCO5446218.1 enterocin 1071A family bacteriocin [Enterococcus faecalis]